ncbi:MAG: hypothetical protein FWH00_02710 [Oscillospiraceae bacterium]|nr:hypothetical protein [Oscillospiraceae bacterium]
MPDKKKESQQIYLTEDQLKAQTARRMEDERLLLAARKPPSELAKKTDNFLYHHKWMAITVAFLVLVCAFMIRDIVFRPKPDFVVVAVSAGNISTDNIEWMGDILSERLSQIRGRDSLVSIDHITLSMSQVPENLRPEWMRGQDSGGIQFNANAEVEMAGMIKLMALNASGQDPIYLLDAAGVIHHMRLAAGSQAFEGPEEEFANWIPDDAYFFYPLNTAAQDIYAFPLSLLDLPPELSSAFEGMSLYLRDVSHNEKMRETFEDALGFFRGLMAVNS